MPEKDDEEKRKEYLAILAIFERFLNQLDEGLEYWEILEELMALRADFAIHHAIKGFGMDWETALDLVANDGSLLSDEDRTRRDIIVAAINNLVDFSVAQEYQLAEDVLDEEAYTEEGEALREIRIKLCRKYNETWATTENLDIEYAMMIAAKFALMRGNPTLMYMTQGDERVRPWHLQFEGFTAPKNNFPAWLIPPIEHACRCFLMEVDDAEFNLSDIQNAVMRFPEMPEWFNRTFKESVALGGRIFSDEHHYFQVKEGDIDRLQEISRRIKRKYING